MSGGNRKTKGLGVVKLELSEKYDVSGRLGRIKIK